MTSRRTPEDDYPEHYSHHNTCDCEPCLALLDRARRTLAKLRARGGLYVVPAPLPRPSDKKT